MVKGGVSSGEMSNGVACGRDSYWMARFEFLGGEVWSRETSNG